MHSFQAIKNKICNLETAISVIKTWKASKEKIVFTNGCFDILHLGHADYLNRAAEKGDRLIIGLNTDKSIQQLKGINRPIQDENARALLLASFTCVDLIIFFEEETPRKLIDTIIPDVLIKGSDYSINQIVGADTVLKNGGEVLTIDFVEGYSTSKIVERIKNNT